MSRELRPSIAGTAAKPPKPIIDALAGADQLGGATDQSKSDPLDVIQRQ